MKTEKKTLKRERKPSAVLSGAFSMYGGRMNKVQRNAKAFSKLLDKEYIFYLGYKGKCQKVVLRFEKRNFHHLEGIGQLIDIMLHSEPADKIFDMADKTLYSL